jgi:hypothetical protein
MDITLSGRGLIWDIFFRPLRKRIGGGIEAFSFDSSACVAVHSNVSRPVPNTVF